MTTPKNLIHNSTRKDQILAALAWQVDIGVDELIDTIPFVQSVPFVGAAPQPVTPHPVAPQPQIIPAKPNIAAPQPAQSLSSLMTLEALFEDMARLDCALKKTAMHFVRPRMKAQPIKSGVLIMDDFPLNDEDSSGQAFTGPKGVLVQNMLKAIDLDIEDCFLCNFSPWRPPGHRQLTEEEIQLLTPYAHRMIEIAAPKYIILMGALCSKAVLGLSDVFSKVKGKWHGYSAAAGSGEIPTIVMHSPLSLLSTPVYKRDAWETLQKFQKALAKG